MDPFNLAPSSHLVALAHKGGLKHVYFDLSSTTQVTPTTTTTTHNETTSQAGNIGQGTTLSNSQLLTPTITGAQNATVSITAESPQALAAAASIAREAIEQSAAASQSALDISARQEDAARQLAKDTTATASEQGTKFILGFGAVVIIGLAVWAYAKKKAG